MTPIPIVREGFTAHAALNPPPPAEAALISIATPALFVNDGYPDIFGVVVPGIFHCASRPTTPPELSDNSEYPVPGVPGEAFALANAAYTALFVASVRAFNVIVKLVALSVLFVAFCTIDPEPFVPDVSTPDAWSTLHPHDEVPEPEILMEIAPDDGLGPNALKMATRS